MSRSALWCTIGPSLDTQYFPGYATVTKEFDLEREHGRHRIVANADGYERVTGDVLVKFGRTTALTVTRSDRIARRRSPSSRSDEARDSRAEFFDDQGCA